MARGEAAAAGRERPTVSVVVPVYNEGGNIELLHDELAPVLDSVAGSWELLFSDDGSTDDTWLKITALHRRDPRVRGVRLAVNMGHQYALLAGYRHAEGEAVITMDGDLQHPPALIPDMVARWRQGARVVQARRVGEKDASLAKRLTSRWFYSLFSLLSGVPLTPGCSDFRLLDRRAVAAILDFGEAGVFWRGLVHLAGGEAVTLDYTARPRRHGRTKYSWLRMWNLAWTGITSFSLVPLRLAVILGGIVSLMSFGELVYVLYVRLCTDNAVPGWASGLAVISFLFGVLFILLGIVGEYVGRILVEVRRRPRYLIDSTLGGSPRPDRVPSSTPNCHPGRPQPPVGADPCVRPRSGEASSGTIKDPQGP